MCTGACCNNTTAGNNDSISSAQLICRRRAGGWACGCCPSHDIYWVCCYRGSFSRPFTFSVVTPPPNGGYIILQRHCVCPDTHDGVTCETSLDACQSNPCVNGTCHNNGNAYECRCQSGKRYSVVSTHKALIKRLLRRNVRDLHWDVRNKMALRA